MPWVWLKRREWGGQWFAVGEPFPSSLRIPKRSLISTKAVGWVPAEGEPEAPPVPEGDRSIDHFIEPSPSVYVPTVEEVVDSGYSVEAAESIVADCEQAAVPHDFAVPPDEMPDLDDLAALQVQGVDPAVSIEEEEPEEELEPIKPAVKRPAAKHPSKKIRKSKAKRG